MKAASKIFSAMTIIFMIILVIWFTQINYNNLSFRENVSAYLGIASASLMIFAMQLIKRQINKKNK